MNTEMHWFLLANVGFAMLWMFYRLFLHRDTLFIAKRFILLLGLVFVLTFPLLNVSDWIPVSQPVQKLTQTFSILLPEITVRAARPQTYTMQELLTDLYILVTLVLLCRVLFQFTKLLVLSRRNPSMEVEGQKIICLPSGSAPFSFFGLVFLQPKDHSEIDLREILHHERTHVRQAHTFDVLLAEIVCTLFWINPFAWLLKYDMRENLEFLADKDVVHAGFDPKSYQYHLLRLSYQQSPIRMGNNFNVSQLQNRIKMMNKKRTSQAGWSKYLLTLPLFAALLLVSYACKNKTEKDTSAKISAESVATRSTEMVDTAAVEAPALKSTVKFVPPKVEKGLKTTIKFTAPVITKEKNTSGAIANVYKTSDATIVVTDVVVDSSKVVYSADEMPKFPGDVPAMIKFISENLHYPAASAELGIEGRVIVRFVVTKTGEVANAKIVRGMDEACNNEAIRVVKAMPKWKPGTVKGVPVDVYFTLPFTFKLSN